MTSSTDWLEQEWDEGGALGLIRDWRFSNDRAEQFLAKLRRVSFDSDSIPKRSVELLWMIPSFLAWNREQNVEHGASPSDYDRFQTQVHNFLEEILGVP